MIVFPKLVLRVHFVAHAFVLLVKENVTFNLLVRVILLLSLEYMI